MLGQEHFTSARAADAVSPVSKPRELRPVNARSVHPADDLVIYVAGWLSVVACVLACGCSQAAPSEAKSPARSTPTQAAPQEASPSAVPKPVAAAASAIPDPSTPRAVAAETSLAQRATRCTEVCDRTTKLGCGARQACLDDCAQANDGSVCGAQMSAFMACALTHPVEHWECTESGVAALRQGYCDTEQQTFVGCFQAAAGRAPH
jgi:hypothetical protein